MAIVLGALMTLAALAAGWNAREAWIARRRRMAAAAAMNVFCRRMTTPATVGAYDQMVAAFRDMLTSDPESVSGIRETSREIATQVDGDIVMRSIGMCAVLFIDGVAMERGLAVAAERGQA